ncbi:MAG: hypothetical protein EOM12_14300 [Verrucomicrobiae bacterium]|nr:hypothetical protein [Verrucomicrobiae bacterium]
MFFIFCRWIFYLPKCGTSNLPKTSRYRKVADYLGGMMDTYAIDTYKKIYGDHEIQRLYKRVWE